MLERPVVLCRRTKVRNVNSERYLHVQHSLDSLTVRWTFGLTLYDLCCWRELACSASNWVLRTGKKQTHGSLCITEPFESSHPFQARHLPTCKYRANSSSACSCSRRAWLLSRISVTAAKQSPQTVI